MAKIEVGTAQLNARVHPALLQRLRLAAARDGRHVQSLVTEGLELALKRAEKRLARQRAAA